MKLPKLPMFVDAAVCTACGGNCCKSGPGITRPEDWGGPDRASMLQRLKAAFATENYSIDWYEGDPRKQPPKGERLSRCMYVRPATAKARGRLFDPSWGGTCTLLTPTGCKLEHDARPYECRALKPLPPEERKKGKGCGGPDIDKRVMSELWIPYQDVITAAAGDEFDPFDEDEGPAFRFFGGAFL